MQLSPPEVSVCVVSLDGHDRLKNLLDSLKEHTSHIDYEVVIVESGPRVRDYVTRMNRALRAGAGKILIGINDDVELTPGWIDPLIAECKRGTPVCFPDQTSTDGVQCLCGWCVVFDADWFHFSGGYDERFVIWASDVDLARRLHANKTPPVRVPIPIPLKHEPSTTTSKPHVSREIVHSCQTDLELYRLKWGTDANDDKYRLKSVNT